MASSLTINSSFSNCPQLLLYLLTIILFSQLISAWENQFELDGKVLELDESNFDAAISNFDYIFVDFYAPWCGYCKSLAPELDKAAPILAGLKQPIAVARVDADKCRKLGSKHDVGEYPTLKIFMHGVPTEYCGPRKADMLVQCLSKFVAPDVAILNSDSAVREFIEAAGTNFPIFIGFGLNESVISNLAVKYKKEAWFSMAKDFYIKSFYDFDKVPALAAIHPTYNEQSIFYISFEENFVEDYIRQSLLPRVLPLNEDSLKSLKDDQRKVVVTIVEDEVDEKSQELIKVLKAAASANRDLIFGYVGTKQWEDFVVSFEVHNKTPLPKMVVWDGDKDYFTVVGSESMDQSGIANQVSRFLEGYREGSIVKKHFSGPPLMAFGASIILILISMVLLIVTIVSLIKEEHLSVGSRYHSFTPAQPREQRRNTVKVD